MDHRQELKFVKKVTGVLSVNSTQFLLFHIHTTLLHHSYTPWHIIFENCLEHKVLISCYISVPSPILSCKKLPSLDSVEQFLVNIFLTSCLLIRIISAWRPGMNKHKEFI